MGAILGCASRWKRRVPLPLPSETRQHLLNAKREVLLALRSLVDTAIERTDAQAEGRADRRRSRIEIDEG